MHFILEILAHKDVTVGNVVGAFKSLCVHHILKQQKAENYDIIVGKIWQRTFGNISFAMKKNGCLLTTTSCTILKIGKMIR